MYGKEIVTLLLAKELCNTGWSPEFIASNWSGHDFRTWLRASGFRHKFLWLGFVSLTLRLYPLKCTFWQSVRLPQLLVGFYRITKTGGLRAVVHTNWQHCLLLLPLLRRQRDIYWAHEIPPLSRRYGYVFRAIGARVGRVVCVSQAVAERMLSLGMPTSRVVVVRSGIPPAEETGPVGGGERLRLGIVGQIGAWKGHGDLIDALGLLQRDGIRPSLLIFGSGAAEYVASLEERAAELGIQQQIEWCGYVTDKSRIFGAIDVCIVPSRCDEALGMSAIEAGGFGCPVICSSRGGLAESVLNGETGLVIEPERPEQLANAIKVFVQNRDLVRTMGAAAQTRARTEFSIQRFGNEFIQVLEELSMDNRVSYEAEYPR